MPAALRMCWRAMVWTVRSREFSEISYDVEPEGLSSIAAAVATMTGVPHSEVLAYAAELLGDETFRSRYAQRVQSTRLRYTCDTSVRYGKHVIQYVIARSVRPRLVVEAGTLNGLGSLAICRALQRNAVGGNPGSLVTVDVRTDRGEFLDGNEGGIVSRVIADSVDVVSAPGEPIDFFIHDTTSDAEHSARQFAALERRLSDRCVVLTSWFTQPFIDFCERNDLAFVEIADRPAAHWYTGSRYGLGRVRGEHSFRDAWLAPARASVRQSGAAQFESMAADRTGQGWP
jgi:predicted O-methyltransferase YrrM